MVSIHFETKTSQKNFVQMDFNIAKFYGSLVN